jgi:hypothetical protein
MGNNNALSYNNMAVVLCDHVENTRNDALILLIQTFVQRVPTIANLIRRIKLFRTKQTARISIFQAKVSFTMMGHDRF